MNMTAHNKYILVFVFILFSNLSYADNLISLLKITGKVQISSDMKSWKEVSNPKKLKIRRG